MQGCGQEIDFKGDARGGVEPLVMINDSITQDLSLSVMKLARVIA